MAESTRDYAESHSAEPATAPEFVAEDDGEPWQ